MKTLQHKTSFGLIAKGYQKYRRTYDPKLYRLLFSLLNKKEKSLHILDIGCGTGKSTEPIFSQMKNQTKAKKPVVAVFGIDPDPMMLKEARISAKKHKLPITYIEGEAEKLPFENDCFDAVISGAAFHWFGNKRALRQIKRVLKKRGAVFIFWVQYIKTDKPAIGAGIYGKYHWQGIPIKFRGQPFVRELLVKSGFKKVKAAAIPFIEKKTIADTIGLIKTNSSYILLSLKDRKNFTREITTAYHTVLKGKKFDVNKMEIRVCYGFKG